MDDTLQELENELKRLRPLTPSKQLLARLEADLAEPAAAVTLESAGSGKITPFPIWLGWRTMSAAAAVVAFSTVIFVSRPAQPGRDPGQAVATTVPTVTNSAIVPTATVRPVTNTPARAQTARYQPVGAASVLYDLREDGKVNLNDRTPARRLRYRYVDTYTWKNPATNASLKWSVPRDEVRVLPASLH